VKGQSERQPSVEPSVDEASASDAPNVTSARKSVKGSMRGGHDPRELARRSALARRLRSQQSSTSPAAPQRDDGGTTENEAPTRLGSDSFSARERLKWEAEHSPSATARVSAARALLDEEPRGLMCLSLRRGSRDVV
jgi:hypothetical protein